MTESDNTQAAIDYYEKHGHDIRPQAISEPPFLVHEYENIVDKPKRCQQAECEPCTWPDCLA